MKTVSFFLLLILSFSAKAQFYLATDMDYNIIMSDSEFNNGASAWGPGFALGYRWQKIAPEFLFKLATAEQRYEGGEGSYDVEIKSKVFAFGGRFETTPWVSTKLGFAYHEVEANYTPLGNSGSLKSTIDGTKFGPYFGGGLKFNIWEGIEVFGDGNFYFDTAKYSLFTLEFGVRYLIP